ncbi:MAG: hypothetical protein HY916_02425 [Desulfovibrio sp.]|jgi:hypothetical protein|nr:hypothetical protein [Desulfovibrio sp.]
MALCSLLLMLSAATDVFAADDTSSTAADPAAVTSFGKLQGVPANTAINGGGMLPAGRAITALNSSYRSKYDSAAGQDLKTNRNIDNTTFVNLLKLRYGVTDRVELQAVVPYIFYDPKSGHNLDSWGDVVIAGMYGIMQEKFGDPLSLAVTLRAGLPTGSMGPSALPGGGAWSGTGVLGLTKTWGRNQVAGDLWYTVPFEEGNAHLRKGDSYGLTYKYAFALTQNLDIGIEGTVERGENGRRLGRDVKNSYLEWYTGPAINYNIPGTTVDLAVGAYLPVYREYGQNTSYEGVRLDGKIFILW